MTRREIYNFFTHFDKLKLPSSNSNHTMKFALGINKSRLEPLYNVIDENRQKVPEYQEFYNKYTALLKQYATKPKDDGDVVKQDLKTGETAIHIEDEKHEEFNAKVEALNGEYKDVIVEVKEAESNFHEYLNGEVEEQLLPKLVKVDSDKLPYDVYMNDDQFYLIAFMVNV